MSIFRLVILGKMYECGWIQLGSVKVSVWKIGVGKNFIDFILTKQRGWVGKSTRPRLYSYLDHKEWVLNYKWLFCVSVSLKLLWLSKEIL